MASLANASSVARNNSRTTQSLWIVVHRSMRGGDYDAIQLPGVVIRPEDCAVTGFRNGNKVRVPGQRHPAIRSVSSTDHKTVRI